MDAFGTGAFAGCPFGVGSFSAGPFPSGALFSSAFGDGFFAMTFGAGVLAAAFGAGALLGDVLGAGGLLGGALGGVAVAALLLGVDGGACVNRTEKCVISPFKGFTLLMVVSAVTFLHLLTCPLMSALRRRHPMQ